MVGKKILYCIVPNCPNRDMNYVMAKRKRRTEENSSDTKTTSSPVSVLQFFSTSPDSLRAKQWLKAIGRPDLKLHSGRRICAEHFLEEDFETSSRIGKLSTPSHYRRLKITAIPSLKIPKVENKDEIGTNFVDGNNATESETTLNLLAADPCLLCGKANVDPPDKEYEFPGAIGIDLLNEQLWATFILRTVLQLPVWRYQQLLETVGKSVPPSKWFVVCKKCSSIVYELVKTYDTIEQLKEKTRKLSDSIKASFHDSLNSDDSNDGNFIKKNSLLDPRVEIQRTFKEGWDKKLQPVPAATLELEEPIEENETDCHVKTESEVEVESQNLKSASESNFGEFEFNNEPIDESPFDNQEIEGCNADSDNKVDIDPLDDEWRPDCEDSSRIKMVRNAIRKLQPEAMTKIKIPRKRGRKSLKMIEDENEDEEEPPSNTKNVKVVDQKKEYCCQICSSKFTYEYLFKTHENLHKSTKERFARRFDCYVCNFPHRKLGTLRNHLLTNHHLKLHKKFNGHNGRQEEYTYNAQTKKAVLGNLLKKCLIVEGEFDTSSDEKVEKSEGEAESKQIKKKKRYQCITCKTKFRYPGNFRKHKKEHRRSKELNGGKYDCCKCNTPHLTDLNLRMHLLMVHKVELSPDWDVNKPQAEYILKPHESKPPKSGLLYQEMEKLKCPQCSKVLKTPKGFRAHKNAHERVKNSEKDTHCPECNYPCLDEAHLKIHTNRMHQGNAKTCERCGFKTGSADKFRHHMFNHKIYDGSVDPSLSTTNFVCNVCKETFSTRRRLAQHKVKKHADDLGLELRWTCEECSKQFSRKETYLNHKAGVHKHADACRFTCDQCGRGYFTRLRLESHMVAHSSLRKEVCPYCSAAYKSDTTLRKHIKIYHPEKAEGEKKETKFFEGVNVQMLEKEDKSDPYKSDRVQWKTRLHSCKYCTAEFPQKTALATHISIAHSELSYPCDLCENKYMSAASLQLHKKANHFSKKVKCGWCSKVVNSSYYLYSHRQFCKLRPSGPEVPLIFPMPCDDKSEKQQGLGLNDDEIEPDSLNNPPDDNSTDAGITDGIDSVEDKDVEPKRE